jgi:hypothetical protein
MIGRIATLALAGAVVVGGPMGSAIAAETRDRDVVVTKRDEDDDEVITPLAGGDDDDDTGTGFTSGADSGDGTNSRKTKVSRDTDRSRGDLTRDRTQDGPGGATRDRSAHATNDRSKHDTR